MIEIFHSDADAAHEVLKSDPSNTELVRFYAVSVRNIAKKQVLRLDPSIKRTLCKKCHMLLVPGITCTVRPKSGRQKRMVVRCLDCSTVKRFVINKNHQLWCDNPEAQVTGTATGGGQSDQGRSLLQSQAKEVKRKDKLLNLTDSKKQKDGKSSTEIKTSLMVPRCVQSQEKVKQVRDEPSKPD